ncbi:hypothetical protein HanOQP8_Chr09g0323911 [Helianthus annuus]|nr:hypothetical protein HanOQP8_Chr09g0323911 [Helianthus annuus]
MFVLYKVQIEFINFRIDFFLNYVKDSKFNRHVSLLLKLLRFSFLNCVHIYVLQGQLMVAGYFGDFTCSAFWSVGYGF